jgi:GH25 family lysozyme M1 (1,4-beta-N-acetylmuramidase)
MLIFIPFCYGRFRLRLAAVLSGLLLAVAGASPAPAAPAAPAPVPVPVPVPVRGSAYMGIGVMAHDGTGGRAEAESPTRRAGQVEGVDVSSHQRDVAWSTLWSSGTGWAYAKATEGTSYKNPYFSGQYDGAYGVGMVRGAYHFATPDSGSGTAQADYFVDHGGAWTNDGRTLPGALDIEWNPYGDACYGKSTSGMTAWIGDFLDRYRARTGRNAVIYTSTSWWTSCTGGYRGFGSTNPLWVARYASSVGALPAGWSAYTMWQYTSSGETVGDHDRFSGSPDVLREFTVG